MTRSSGAVLTYGRGELSEPILEQTIGDAPRAAAAALRGPCTALVEGTLAAARRRWSYDQLLAKVEQTARSGTHAADTSHARQRYGRAHREEASRRGARCSIFGARFLIDGFARA
jgi:hypothetical protein